MAKKTIHLTESELKEIVKQTTLNVIQSALNENRNFAYDDGGKCPSCIVYQSYYKI